MDIRDSRRGVLFLDSNGVVVVVLDNKGGRLDLLLLPKGSRAEDTRTDFTWRVVVVVVVPLRGVASSEFLVVVAASKGDHGCV
jgi:hypothetical protein